MVGSRERRRIMDEDDIPGYLMDLCETWIKTNKVTCVESIYQRDNMILKSLDLVEEICELVGFYEYKEDDYDENDKKIPPFGFKEAIDEMEEYLMKNIAFDNVTPWTRTDTIDLLEKAHEIFMQYHDLEKYNLSSDAGPVTNQTFFFCPNTGIIESK